MMYIIIAIVAISVVTAIVNIMFVSKKIKTHRQSNKMRKNILAEGQSTKAIINAIQATNASLGGQHPKVILDLAVTMPNGETLQTAVETYIHIVHVPSFQPGKEIDVKYLIIDGIPKFEVVGAVVL